MPSISILPSDVADQIAAGEVVERPASVVKELVENAIDAGAGSISIEIEEGGRGLIRVSDDGSGMSREDALLALQRHGTSKIRTASDLERIASFGFRGEALPAIASVSMLVMQTYSGEAAGTAVRVSGGSVEDVSETSRQRGTTISVTRLFSNVPARLKFLRSARSEWRSISDTVAAIALSRREVRFNVTTDGREILNLPPAPDLRARVAAIWGARYAAGLVAVDDVSGTAHISGLVERPSDVGTGSRHVVISLNGRVIRDVGITRAAEAAYKSTIGSGLRPALFLNVTVPADTVDVNVHPAKAEVRFRDRWPLERAVEGAVRRALGTMESSATVGAPLWFRGVPSNANNFVSGEATDVIPSTMTWPSEGFASGQSADISDDAGDRQDVQTGVPPLTQLRRTYVVFEHEDGLVMIDQHSAHERILFERFMQDLNAGRSAGQRLLLPLTLHLSDAEVEGLDGCRDSLEKLGYEMENFGGNSILVTAVPTPHPRFDAERCLRDTLGALAGSRDAGTAARHERLAATFACKSAVKAGDSLSQEEMRALFIALRDTELPAHDVHGRSTIVKLSWEELERRFGRR